MALLVASAGLGAEPGDKPAGFADRLFQQGRYAEALIEYERAVFHSPALEDSPRVAEKILECLLLTGSPDRALARSRDWRGKSGELGCVAGFYEGRALFALGRYPEAEAAFQKVAEGCPRPFADHGRYWSGLALLRAKDFGRAEAAFSAVPDGTLGPPAQSASRRAREGTGLEWKSPRTAAISSLFLPGAGYAYAGYPQTALTAFLTTALFTWGTVASARNDNAGLAVVLGLISATWYFGGAYGSAAAARRRNDRMFHAYLDGFPYP